ncbi:hypothetical protein I4U23_023530, partial [Adineta vaga]
MNIHDEIQLQTIKNSQQKHSFSNSTDYDVISIVTDDRKSIEDDPIQRKNYDKKITPSIKIALLFAIFTSIVMTIGIIIVCVTHHEPVEICESSYERTVHYSLTFDSRPRAIVLADINQDDKLDIIVANS